ncbi:hypothetical protein V6N12_016482 [Hibiscus sabdariffa]|uniref:RRM domain-containing protein n=1 Tax=Hibiscus sabdariffa TaxID=183260 RepID=A0ABR2CDR1_9ROSI
MAERGAEKSRSFAGAEKKDYGLFFPGVRRHQKIANVGVSIFVNFVSNRIHRATLRNAFLEYGKVIGTYIAYHNVKRIKSKHTFAFVRFASRDDAERAVERGNNKRMDGFYIKVFLEKKHTRTVGTDVELPACGLKACTKHGFAKNKYSTVRRDRSFKDVLLNVPIPRKSENSTTNKSRWQGKDESSVTDISLLIPFAPSESDWLRQSFVRQIKGMYNAEVLASVSSLSDVPCDACVELNGDKFLIKMSTVEFEDNCCWLDDDCPVNNSVEENSCRFEDIPHAFNVSEAPFSPRAEWARNNNDNVLNGDPTLLKEENVDCNSSRSFSKDITAQVRVSGPDSLHNVPILVASDNSMSSTGYSEPIVPVLDKESDGLAIENNASMEAMEGEACECLEVCNAAGLFFNATDKEVGKRFVELESELGDPKKWFDFWEDDKELVESLHVLCLNMRGIGIGNILRRCKKGVKFCLFQKKFDKQDSIPVMENIISILEADLANGIQISTSGVEL